MTECSILAHGGALVDLIADPERAADLTTASRDWPSWDLTPRQLCDVELLLNGGYSPLRGFMGRRDYESTCGRMRLADGTLWPIPITLDVAADRAERLERGAVLALRDPEGVMLAALHVEDIWQPDREAEAEAVYGTSCRSHPGVARLLGEAQPFCVGGTLEGLQRPLHYDFRSLRLTPRALRAESARLGWRRTAAVQTSQPLHRAELESTWRAAREAEAGLLIHPPVGLSSAGDVAHYNRIRAYTSVLQHYPEGTAKLALLPLAPRLAGAREALWRAIVAKNYGCTHLLAGRDHADLGVDGEGRPFCEPAAPHDLLLAHQGELGVGIVPWRPMVYLEDRRAYMLEDEVPAGARPVTLPAAELRRLLARGTPIPRWFTFDDVGQALQQTHPPRRRQGFTVFFTGLPSSGKSTIANVLRVKLLEMGGRGVTLLDGDLVRKHLSSELGFSREHRDLNIRRIAFVASEITRHGGVAICAPIAPYDRTRKDARAMIEPHGGFVLVCVSTPVDICETRDRKGLYAKARAGIVREFTGVSDPYEVPDDAELALDTTKLSPEEAAEAIIGYLQKEGYLGGEEWGHGHLAAVPSP